MGLTTCSTNLAEKVFRSSNNKTDKPLLASERGPLSSTDVIVELNSTITSVELSGPRLLASSGLSVLLLLERKTFSARFVEHVWCNGSLAYTPVVPRQHDMHFGNNQRRYYHDG
ncbi:hypothetical protein Y032_0939g3128 [Ancylostoma ceylanicum]|uniref:Uncharacterized protein n=1 Tax=Ancylostoma ceylanicum TaxID=53326 RepID=A0A016W9Z0_9BILA|nr:hypothetical protein Y032_0939g3128 [Ancylostoma ceylanicum]